MKKFYFTELWNLMKICAAQGFIAVLICGVSLAHDNNAQILDREISVDLKQASFESALEEISRAANAYFSYSPDLVKVDEKITLKVEKQTLRKVLTDLLAPFNIRYAVNEDDATISLKPSILKRDNEQKSNVKLKAQISGTVSDSKGHPIPGVNIVVKGTATGTTTDQNGNYFITAEPDDVLVFSFIGFAPVEDRVGNRTTIDVVLQEDVKSLEEVVINVGYWDVKQREQTGNVVRITSEQIEKQPISNTMQSLQGRMTGVYVQQNTGIPGGGFKIQIRGQNSLRTDGNNPLYVVDGVPFTSNSLTSQAISGLIVTEGSPLASLSPSDIESIEVLKDADATAIYGSRGSNGVVLITTKKGKVGKTKVDLNWSSGVAQVGHQIKLLNTQQHVAMRKQALQNDGFWPLPQEWYSIIPDVFLWDTTRYTDWQDKLIGGTATTSNGRLSISGGNEQTKFTLAGGYYKETTVFPGDYSFQRFSGSVGISHTSENKKLNLSTSINYTSSVNDLLPLDLTSLAMSLPPNAPALYKEDGSINWDWMNNDMQNPLASTKMLYRSITNNFVSNANVSYELFKGFQVKASAGYTSMRVDEISTSPISSIPPQFFSGQTGSSNFGNGNLSTWIVEPQLLYNKTISKGILNLIFGSTFQNSSQSNETITARGYTSDALLENIKAATSWEIPNSSYFQYRYAALFARANYTWDEKYIVNLTARRDGSSRFGSGNRFGNFGAAGIAWIFSNENFLKESVPVLSFGKLRTSYGITGSDAIGNYQYLPTYSPATYPYNGQSALTLTRLSNPDYSWETNKKFEVGIDLGFIDDRIYIDASYYLNRSSNQLVGLPLPLITGQSSVQFNLPATVENRGWEFQLRTINIKSDAFSWQTAFNITLPQNQLIEFPNIEAFPAYKNRFAVGKSVFSKKTLISTGVDPETGLYTFKDIDGDGAATVEHDGQFAKEVSQKYYGGVNNSLKYGNFQLDIFFQFVKQTGYSYMASFPSPGSFSNQPDVVVSRWEKPGDISNIQQYSLAGGTTAYYNYLSSDAAIVDASFIRLKNVSLSWDIPRKWLSKTPLQASRIFVLGQNLFTFTNYLGLDPENQNVNFLPPLRTISFGANITL